MLLVLLVSCLTTARSLNDPLPSFRLSLTLADHAVLLKNVPNTLWGFAPPGAVVTARLDGAPAGVPGAAGSDGVWRVVLPAQPAGGPHVIDFASSDGSAPLQMGDVLFGEVFACGGQSNMAFSVSEAYNASTEEQAANAYPFVRHMTVPPGQPHGTATDLAKVVPWALASNVTVGALSAVCWFHAKRLVDTGALGTPPTPIGLIANSVGGTAIEYWSTLESRKACDDPSLNPPSPAPATDGDLFASMIAPFTTGPTALAGWLWFQVS